LRISQITSGVPTGLSPLFLSIIITVILVPIILAIIEIIRTKKQKKSLSSSIIYDNQLISIKGEAQREPWKDKDGLSNYPIGDEYFLAYEWEHSKYSNGVFTFCNKISLTIKNEGHIPIDTDVHKEPLVFSIDVRGKLASIKTLAIEPNNSKLDLSASDGMVKVEHLYLEPSASLNIIFLGYFIVNLEELY
jgi:hypothetical protein